MKDRAYLLIARKDGSSSSRRQRAFADRADVDRAIRRWRSEGFNTWWLYGERPISTWGPTCSTRPLLRQWRDALTNTARAARVERALDTYAQRCYSTQADQLDDATVAQDFVTDIFHWIYQRGLLPGDIAQRAAVNFQAEVEEGQPRIGAEGQKDGQKGGR